MEGFSNFVDFLNGIAWGPWMLILLVGTGIFLSSRMGFIQFTRFGYAMKNTLGKVFKKQDAGHALLQPSVPATSPASPAPSPQAAPAQSSGCGSPLSSAWPPNIPRLSWR